MSTFFGPPLTKETESLCEAVADLAASFITASFVPADSRLMNDLCILWAREFEERNRATDWSTDGDYISAIDAFFQEKHSQWVLESSAYDLRPGDFCTQFKGGER